MALFLIMENSMGIQEPYTVLIAEDDPDIIAVLKLYLENGGYKVESASDGREALQILDTKHVDIGIFDIMMPHMNGYELIRRVRETSNMPIIVLSAKKEDSDKILGLDLGADDYLTKPFNPLEVVARVRASLRRFYKLSGAGTGQEDALEAGPFRIDRRTMQLFKDGQEISVTPMELKIMLLLMSHPGRVYTKLQIYEAVSGECFAAEENTIMVHISNLRDKIEEDSKKPKYLITVRGLGYRFANQNELRKRAEERGGQAQ
jgi:DNA-binding response OmpR family regulator